MKRRAFLLVTLLFTISQRVLAKLQPTPADSEGPFYPVEPIRLDNDLVHHAGGTATGEQLELSGIIKDSNGKPLANALIEIWQCDANGRYHHPQDAKSHQPDQYFAGFGATRTSATGAYQFQTLMPVPYGNRPPHIHVKIYHNDKELLTTQIYLKGKEKEGGLLAWLYSGDRSERLIEPTQKDANTWQSQFDFVLESNNG